MPTFQLEGKVETNNIGNQKLLDFYNYCKNYSYSTITLDVNHLLWIDANLSALLLAIRHTLAKTNKLKFFIDFACLKGDLNVLIRNGFSNCFTGNSRRFVPEDFRKSTIPLKAFKIDDADSFASYIQGDLLSHRGLETVKFKDKDKVKDSYFEIFDNVGIHSKTTEPIIACGQYFPRNSQLKFTLVDMGQGFLKEIAEFTKRNERIIKTSDAINWAIRGNSTKKGIGGGIGLNNILNFCLKSDGEIHIITDDCYWYYADKKITHFSISNHFIGATIHLVFRYLN